MTQCNTPFVRRVTAGLLVAVSALSRPLAAQQVLPSVLSKNDSVSIRLIDVDLRTAVQALARYLDRPLVVGAISNATRVTLETPRPVPHGDVLRILRGLSSAHQVELIADTVAGVYRLQQREAPAPSQSFQSSHLARPAGIPELFVIRLRHARASDVSATINALYGKASALGELGAGPAPLSRELQQNQVPPTSSAPAQAVASIAGRNATLAGELTIVPDVRGNSLLVRASPSDFALIEAAIRELDVRPLQVLIKVLIAELRKDRSFDFGVELKLPITHVGGSDNTTVQATTTGGGLGDFALKVMGIGPYDIDATIRASAARGDATIVSRPILLAANNERAEINVGSQRPFVQVARVLPTDNTARDQVVQYKDVGTKLSILPSISGDGYVMLQVMQEISAATAETQFNAPIISNRSVETRLLIRDSQTVVLGGLTDHQREASQGGVPLLSSIPILGALFGRVSRRTSETELFIFLTPYIIRSDAATDSLNAPLHRRAKEITRDH